MLLYGPETWLFIEEMKAKLQSFIKYGGPELYRMKTYGYLLPAGYQRRNGWIGHALRKPYDDPPHAALAWNPQGVGVVEDHKQHGAKLFLAKPANRLTN